MPQPHRVPAIRDDNDPIPASGKQSVCCPKGTGGSGQLPGGILLTEDRGEGSGVGAVADTEVRTHQPVLVSFPSPTPRTFKTGENGWGAGRTGLQGPLAGPGETC